MVFFVSVFFCSLSYFCYVWLPFPHLFVSVSFTFWIYPQMSGHPWLSIHIWECISNSWLEAPVHGQGHGWPSLRGWWANHTLGTTGCSVTPEMNLPTSLPGFEQSSVHIPGCWCSSRWTEVTAGLELPIVQQVETHLTPFLSPIIHSSLWLSWYL